MRACICFGSIILLITITAACSVYQAKNPNVPVITDIPVSVDEPVGTDEPISNYESVSSGPETIHAVTGPIKDLTTCVYTLDYTNENTVIFHADFGLFIYDLGLEAISYSFDFSELSEVSRNHGDDCPGVRVVISEDGSLIQLSGGVHPPYFVISTYDGTYTVEGYWTVLDMYKPSELQGELFSLHPEGAVGDIDQQCFRRGEYTWVLFANWDF